MWWQFVLRKGAETKRNEMNRHLQAASDLECLSLDFLGENGNLIDGEIAARRDMCPDLCYFHDVLM